MVGAFRDIEEAFNCTSIGTVCSKAAHHGVSQSLIRWMGGMLICRTVVAELGTKSILGVVSRGCSQGGVASPTVWCLVANELLRMLNCGRCYAQVYADDCLVLIKGRCINMVIDAMQVALRKIVK